MVASTVFFYANSTLWAVLCVSRNVVCRLTIISALCEPFLDGDAVSGRVVVIATSKAKARFAHFASCLLSTCIGAAENCLAVSARAETQLGMWLHVVLKRKLLVLVSYLRTQNKSKYEILGNKNITAGRHTANLRGDSLRDLNFKVHWPAVPAETVCAR